MMPASWQSANKEMEYACCRETVLLTSLKEEGGFGPSQALLEENKT